MALWESTQDMLRALLEAIRSNGYCVNRVNFAGFMDDPTKFEQVLREVCDPSNHDAILRELDEHQRRLTRGKEGMQWGARESFVNPLDHAVATLAVASMPLQDRPSYVGVAFLVLASGVVLTSNEPFGDGYVAHTLTEALK